MNLKIVLFSMTALALVSACSRGQTNNVAAKLTSNAAASPASTANAAPTNTGTVDQAFLIGRWGENGNLVGQAEPG